MNKKINKKIEELFIISHARGPRSAQKALKHILGTKPTMFSHHVDFIHETHCCGML